MNLLKVSDRSLATLREILAMWPTLRARLSGVLPVRGAGAAIVSQTKDAVTIYVAPPAPVAPGKNGDGSAWFKIKSNSSVGTNQWNYKGRRMQSGDASSLTGLVETVDTTEFDMRNAYESVALGGVADIASLTAIATGSVVRAWPEVRNNVLIWVFERANDVVCA